MISPGANAEVAYPQRSVVVQQTSANARGANGMHKMLLIHFVVAANTLGCATAAIGNTPPNLILIVTGDQDYWDTGATENPYTRTPNMDRIAIEGVHFKRSYAAATCPPTRAGLMTARYHGHIERYLFPGQVVHNATPVEARDYVTDLFTDAAIDFIKDVE